MAAVLDDEEVAEAVLRSGVDERDRPPDMTGWTREVELLTALVEAVTRLHAWQVGAHSRDHKVPKVPPLTRPQTAAQRVRVRVLQDQLRGVVEAFQPRE